MEDFKRRRSHFAPCKRVRQSAVGQSNRRRNPPKRLQSLPVSAQENLHLAFKAPSKRTQTNRCVTELPPSKHKPQPKALHEEQTPIEAHSAQEFLEVFDPLNPLAMVEAARSVPFCSIHTAFSLHHIYLLLKNCTSSVVPLFYVSSYSQSFVN